MIWLFIVLLLPMSTSRVLLSISFVVRIPICWPSVASRNRFFSRVSAYIVIHFSLIFLCYSTQKHCCMQDFLRQFCCFFNEKALRLSAEGKEKLDGEKSRRLTKVYLYRKSSGGEAMHLNLFSGGQNELYQKTTCFARCRQKSSHYVNISFSIGLERSSFLLTSFRRNPLQLLAEGKEREMGFITLNQSIFFMPSGRFP